MQATSLQNFGTIPAPNKNQNIQCPICLSGIVTGLYVEPLNFSEIEQAIALKKSTEREMSSPSSTSTNGKKHGRDDDPEIEAHSTYLLLSNNHSTISSSNLSREQQRTGRWTNDEIAFVDYLVNAFDKGSLPLPHGVKLNEFLGDILLCKSSRLTKKMKNAKLSTRSFVLGNIETMPSRCDRELLSNLQERFLASMPSESTRLELRFNLAKQWRTHFSNLCLQVGYPFLDSNDWVASLEEIETRATQAEDAVRRVRRRKMSQALQTDGGSTANSSVFIGGVHADTAASQLQNELSITFDVPRTSDKLHTISADENHGHELEDSLDFLNSGFRSRSRTLSLDFLNNIRDRAFSDDFDAALDTLINESGGTVAEAEKAETSSPHSCGLFLDAIVSYMEARNLPFQHADLWVPSFAPSEGAKAASQAVDTDRLRLHHAGHASRGDLDESVAYKLREFGVYSDNFSFEPGHGLPGRVYETGEIFWERNVAETDPNVFERCGGAKVYGIKTAVGIPLSTDLVGRIVVTMYSCQDVPENMPLARDCAAELAKYSPEPKWKLCIDTTSLNPGSMPMTPMQLAAAGLLDADDNLSLSSIFEADQQPSWESRNAATNASLNPTSGTFPDNEEKQLVALLGSHMPVDHDPSSESRNQLQLFMTIRLLLLRPSCRRSAQENEMITILKNSFRAYMKDGQRDGKELARLLVKDWECLQMTYSLKSSTSPVASQVMPKPLPPAGHRFSVPVERRLTAEPSQRQPSSSSSSHGFLPSPTSSLSLNPPIKNVSTASLKSHLQSFGHGQPLANRLPPPTSQQLSYTRYLPRTSCQDNSAVSSSDVSNTRMLFESPNILIQSTIPSTKDQSVNQVSPVVSESR